jgi:hypothetical protein
VATAPGRSPLESEPGLSVHATVTPLHQWARAQYLASFAGRDAVVVARGLVAAHFAWDKRLGGGGTVGVRCSVMLL